MKRKRIKLKNNILRVDVNLDKALGAAHREEYLENNPHGYAKVNHIHKNKKAYIRKEKRSDEMPERFIFVRPS